MEVGRVRDGTEISAVRELGTSGELSRLTLARNGAIM